MIKYQLGWHPDRQRGAPRYSAETPSFGLGRPEKRVDDYTIITSKIK
jgi:hypothetical protein